MNCPTHISPASQPTLLITSENDHLVPPQTVRDFDATARQRGVVVRTISVPFAEHGFDTTGIVNAIVRQATLQFISEHNR